MDYKICVYAICKNEKEWINRWIDNMSEADYIVVLDTGSTDGSYEMLKEDSRITRVEQKIINPWRFDAARNESMKLVPEDTDIFVCTDFDEVFEEEFEWRVYKIKEGISAEEARAALGSHDEDGFVAEYCEKEVLN